MLKEALKGNVQVIDTLSDWEEAIKIASQPLLDKSKIKESYITKMINNLKELGPYVILVPKVAMPHSRPEHGVNETCLSLLKVSKGVSFSPKKDDVNLIFILGAIDNTSHVDMLTELSDLLEEEERIEDIIKAQSAEEIWTLI